MTGLQLQIWLLHMISDTIYIPSFVTNVLAETSGGRDDQVVMVGAHLDSVTEGPGIQGKFVCNFCDTLFSFVWAYVIVSHFH